MPSRERKAYVLNIVDHSLVYEEVVYNVIRPECMLCGSTTMSSLGVVFFCRKWGGIHVDGSFELREESGICFDGCKLFYNIQRGCVSSFVAGMIAVWKQSYS